MDVYMIRALLFGVQSRAPQFVQTAILLFALAMVKALYMKPSSTLMRTLSGPYAIPRVLTMAHMGIGLHYFPKMAEIYRDLHYSHLRTIPMLEFAHMHSSIFPSRGPTV